MKPPIEVDAVRDETVESVHLVDVAVIDAGGRLIASAGDPDRVATFRSSAKPIQARVARALGWEPADPTHLAIACASHSGEDAHVEVVRAVLASAGLAEDALRCPATLALQPGSPHEPAAIRHNCSGKHAGMLAACVAAGLPTHDYLDVSHPLQQRIASELASIWGDRVEPLTDGCGAPTYAASLRQLARAFATVTPDSPESLAMRAHPFLVGGTGRFDTDIMGIVPGLCAKGGAEALFCATDGDTTLALKVRDGGARAVGPAVARVLGELGMADAASIDAALPLVTGGGRPVGRFVARGSVR